MSSTKLPTSTPVATARRRTSPRKRRFDRKAQNDLRQLLAALREIGDRPNLEQILQRYEIRRDRLKAFVKKIEVEALMAESFCSC